MMRPVCLGGMPSAVSRKTKAARYQKHKKGMAQLLVVMNVFIMLFCEVLEFLM